MILIYTSHTTDKGRWVITLCVDCNALKYCLDPAEFLQQVVRMVGNYKRLLSLCEKKEDGEKTSYTLVDFDELIKNGKSFGFGRNEKSISSTRKGNLDKLCKDVEAPLLVADLKSQYCYYCDLPLSFGVDRLLSNHSYAKALRRGQALPCCNADNMILSSHKLIDVLTQMARIVLHIAYNWERSDRLACIFFGPTLGMLSAGNYERKPVKVVIKGVTVMFPSIATMRSFPIPTGTEIVAASILEFNQWRESLTEDDVVQIRSLFDINTDVRPDDLGKWSTLSIIIYSISHTTCSLIHYCCI